MRMLALGAQDDGGPLVPGIKTLSGDPDLLERHKKFEAACSQHNELINRADGMDAAMNEMAFSASKKARTAERLMQASEAKQGPWKKSCIVSATPEDPGVLKAWSRSSDLLQAKSSLEAYNIHCYSLPLPVVGKDFLRSPPCSTPKLQIKPLDITGGLSPSTATNDDWLKAPLKATDLTAGVAGSSQPQLRSPSFMLIPAKISQTQPQGLVGSFQQTMTQHKHTEACAANRKAAILRFRAKRQQRSFGKKVRYVSRKRLADQRPRIKGQFVKAPEQEKSLE